MFDLSFNLYFERLDVDVMVASIERKFEYKIYNNRFFLQKKLRNALFRFRLHVSLCGILLPWFYISIVHLHV